MGLLSGVEGGKSQELVGGEVDETYPVSHFLVRFLGLPPAGQISTVSTALPPPKHEGDPSDGPPSVCRETCPDKLWRTDLRRRSLSKIPLRHAPGPSE